MSYKIALGSSDGKNVDLKFGEIRKFVIFEVEEEKGKISEIRNVEDYTTVSDIHSSGRAGSCGSSGCGGNGNGCRGDGDTISKVETIKDCRCVVCKKIGFHAQKQLERNAISAFDIEGPVDEILEKIIAYYRRIDKHKS